MATQEITILILESDFPLLISDEKSSSEVQLKFPSTKALPKRCLYVLGIEKKTVRKRKTDATWLKTY